MTQLTFADLPRLQPSDFADVSPRIVEQFFQYHEKNPHIFRLFSQYAWQVRKAGVFHYGAKAIMERIRWHYEIDQRAHEFKINNNYASCYARLLIQQDPAFTDFFELRSHLKAA